MKLCRFLTGFGQISLTFLLFVCFSNLVQAVAVNLTIEPVVPEVVITQPTTITASDTSFDGKSIVVDGVSLVIDGAHTFQSFRIINGGVLTHATATSAEAAKLVLTVDSLEIDATSRIDVSGKGLGPSAEVTGRSGGSYGGRGGDESGTSNPQYGDLRAPFEFGTGGQGNTEARGGGLVKVIAQTLVLDGEIWANGGQGSSYTGGGSGGSVWLDVGVLNGAGSIHASGASSVAGAYQRGGGGGGGRVALYYTEASGFDLSALTVFGGNGNRAPAGGAGTVYWQAKSDPLGQLRIDNGTRSADSAAGLDTAGALLRLGINNGRVTLAAGLEVPELLLTNSTLITQNDMSGTSVTVDASTLTLNGSQQWDTVQLKNGSVLTHATATSADAAKLALTVDSLEIDATSRIDVSGKGLGPSAEVTGRSGGSYGGRGGDESGTSNPQYGDLRAPFEFGTGGQGNTEARGGGLVKVIAQTLVLDGEIWANGGQGSSYTGGGSGGSVWLDVGVLNGAGSIHASGASSVAGAYQRGGGGGGGRVALYYTEANAFDLSALKAFGGNGNRAPDGGAGTVFIKEGESPLFVVSSSPVGSVNQAVSVLSLQFSTVVDDIRFTVDDLSLTGPSQSVITGIQASQTSNAYTILLQDSLTVDGEYTLAVGPDIWSSKGNGMDQDRDELVGESLDDVYRAMFTLDTAAPSLLTVSNYPASPAVTTITSAAVVLEGGRDDDSSVWVNDGLQDRLIVALGSGPWSGSVDLSEGVNQLTVTAQDEAGNSSNGVNLEFFADRIAPTLAVVTPADNTFSQVVPTVVVVDVVETGSGLDVSGSSLAMTKDAVSFSGNWSVNNESLIFTPDVAFTEGNYALNLQLKDLGGLESNPTVTYFTIDQTPPLAPTLADLPVSTTINSYTVNGGKEAYAAIWFAGQQVVASTSDATWSHTVSLSKGVNNLVFTARDRAGNESLAASAVIIFDDDAPGPVTVAADGTGIGTVVGLEWSTYDEFANGNDIRDYAVYISTTAFSNISAANFLATVPAGTKAYQAQSLLRDQSYHFAVVATDLSGNVNNSVVSVAVSPADNVAPENVGNLRVDAGQTQLVIRWNHSADSAGDLASYKVYFNNDAGTLLDGTVNSHTVSGLTPSSAYPIRVSAIDQSDNESAGVSLTGVTLLRNPISLTVEPFSGLVDMNWMAVSPANLVKQYAVYAETTDFSSVSGKTPRLRVVAGTTSTRLAGLENGIPYYFAVTTINTSGGETQAVTTVTATPEQDQTGPKISSPQFSGAALADGYVITRPGAFSLSATDPAGVSRVEFLVDSVVMATDTNGSDGYSAHWAIYDVADGAHSLSFIAYDSFGNSSQLDVAVTVALAAPVAPMVTQPVDGTATNENQVTVEGTAEQRTEVLLYNNDVQVAGPITVDSNGHFRTSVTLTAGNNVLQAAAQNRGGAGLRSTALTVIYDNSIPDAPIGLSVRAKEGGQISVSWSTAVGGEIVAFDIYRSLQSFDVPAQASKVNSNGVLSSLFTDLPPDDGTYYYRVVSVNELGTVSLPSNQASATADGTLPQADRIEYQPQGLFDVNTGRMAPGRVDVVLSVSEPLLTTPFLSLTPEQGIPIAVNLSRVTDTEYSASFDITENTPTGIVYAVFSARDQVGNRGTVIVEGATLNIDTDGPDVTQITLNPGHPIQNDSQAPRTVEATLALNGEIKSGELPQLAYQLSGTARQVQPISQVEAIDSHHWRATFTLPADGGLAEVETLSFVYEGLDDLDNRSSRIRALNRYQVYQGELPPLDSPTSLTAKALPGGEVQLTWSAADEAVDYQLYRQAPGETVLSAYQTSAAALTFTDQPGLDGSYQYAVASIRRINSQESVGAQGAAVEVDVDSVVPTAPQSLTLELVGNGILVTWQASASSDVDSYRLYRSSADTITAVIDATLVTDKIRTTQTVDGTPSATEHAYVVTAVDATGNESAISNSAYLNFDLLPIASFSIVQEGEQTPQLSWSHSSNSIDGYNVYLETGGTPLKLNGSLVAGLGFNDGGYSGDSRHYRVTAVDTNGVESIARSLLLPQISAVLAEGSTIKRGIMNRLEYVVSNASSTAVDSIQLRVSLGGREHPSARFNLLAGESKAVTVIVGGFQDLATLSSLTTTIHLAPNEGEQVSIIRHQDISVGDSALVLSLQTENFTRGGTGTVRFTLENSSDVAVEVVTATRTGNDPSGEVRLLLLDVDGNVLTTTPVHQALGAGVLTLSNGTTVARIAAGESFSSAPVTLQVPSGASEQVTARLVIDALHYHLGQDAAVSIEGMQSSRDTSLVDTAYVCDTVQATPLSSFGDEDVVISGYAIDRLTSSPVPFAPLKLAVQVRGFERSFDIQTDDNGAFSHRYTPEVTESGTYTVSCLHPDLSERPNHAQFNVGRLFVQPTDITLNMPYNFVQSIPIQVRAGDGVALNNVRLVYEAAEQSGAVLPQGMQVTIGPAVNLAAGAKATININVSGDNSASASGTLILTVYSDETGTNKLDEIQVKYTLSEASPALYFSPNFVETGLARGQSVTETLNLENRGFAAIDNMTLRLLTDADAPAPDWIYLTTSHDQGSFDIGEQRSVSIAINPPEIVAEGIYQFKLRVAGSNFTPTDINIFVSVTQSGQGNVLFKLSDIYTATLDKNGNPIPGLANARIRVQNEDVTTVEQTLNSDNFGEALFNDLPAGRYVFRASANNHESVTGRFRIKPGLTASQDVFLDYNLITVEWSVTEITLQDRYEITLQATYETDVPAAVVVMEPSSVTLPDMVVGDVFYGEFTLTNYGLVRAENLAFNLPPNDGYFRYEALIDVPDSLSAKERLTIPYRVVNVALLDPVDGAASGGGCSGYSANANANYDYECANGTRAAGGTNSSFTSPVSGSCGGAGVGGGAWFGGGSGGGSSSSGGGGGSAIGGSSCPADCGGSCCDGGGGDGG